MKSISPTAKLYSNVDIASPCRVDDFVVLGALPERDPESTTPAAPLRIGAGSHIRSHSVVYAGNVIGIHFITGHSVLVRELNSIGDHVSIGTHSVVEHHVTIGHRVRLHSGVFVPEYCILEDDAWLGPHAVLTNTRHPRCVNMPRCLEPVIVKAGAKIGANATLLPGVTIGKGALVAAGAIVTKDVPPGMVVAGNPAQVISSTAELKCSMDQLTSPYPAD